jgi:glycosyltransferase involved in cell wall biosynthesis
MKKLLIVSDTYAPRIDGITSFLLEIIPRLKSNFDVKVLAPDFGKYPGSVQHIKVPLFNVFVGDFQIAKPVLSKIKEAVINSDIVFIQTIGMVGYLAIKYAKKYNKPIVTYKHIIEWELVPHAVNRKLLFKILSFFIKLSSRSIFNKCNLIICPSHTIAEKLSWYKIKPRKAVVPVGIDSSKFIPPKNKKEAKESIGLDPKNLIIGYHGRLANEKGIKILVRVYKQLSRKYKNLRLLILGDGLEELKHFVKEKGAIYVTGKKNVIPYLQAMDIYCMPSFTETSCLSLIEAMSCELPVITTNAGMIGDYVKDNENGLIIEKKNTYSLFKAIKNLINNDEKKKTLGVAARKTVLEIFDWEVTSKKIIKILTDYLDEK